MPMHAYAPAKAAVIAITECLAAEWGRSGVRVNAVSPGYTLTPALQAAIDKGQRDVSMLNENSALGRMVSPEEVARAVCFLASEDASAITGANLPVDCGWLVTPSWHTYTIDSMKVVSCHKGGFILVFGFPHMSRVPTRERDEKSWQRGGGRLSCRLEKLIRRS